MRGVSQGLWISFWRKMVVRDEDMYDFTYFRGKNSKQLEFWNRGETETVSIQNGGEVLQKRVFIYIVVVVVEL